MTPGDKPAAPKQRRFAVEHPYVVFGLAAVGLVFAYLGVANAARWPPFRDPEPPAFEANFILTESVKAADAVERLTTFLAREETNIVFLHFVLQQDVARIAPPAGGPIKTIRFRPTCWLARHSRIAPETDYSCDRLHLDVVRRPGEFDLGTARWLTVATAQVQGYFRVGLNISAVGYNRIQVMPVVKPD